MKNSKIIAMLIVICVSFSAVSYAKFTTSFNLDSISLQLNANVIDYEVPLVVDNNKLFVRDKFINGLISDKEYMTTSSNQGDNFKITDEGLYINDTKTTASFWCFIAFVDDDGYSTALNVNHVYYARCIVRIDTIGDENSYFSFGFCNTMHNASSGIIKYGLSTNTTSKKESTDGEYSLVSIHGAPTISRSEELNGETLAQDYCDTLQFGTPGSSIVTAYVQNVMMFDLSTLFGLGNEPPKSWCDKNIGINTSSASWIKI